MATYREKRAKKRKNKITNKQKIIVRATVQGLPSHEAAEKAGSRGTKKTQSEVTCRTLAMPHVQKWMAKYMEKYDLTEDRIAREIDRGLKTGKVGSHEKYVSHLMSLHGAGKEVEKNIQDPLRLDVLLGVGKIEPGERTKFGESTMALRISRGMHPSEDRHLTVIEIKYYSDIVQRADDK